MRVGRRELLRLAAVLGAGRSIGGCKRTEPAGASSATASSSPASTAPRESPSERPAAKMSAEILVVGAGVSGLAAAHDLVGAGRDVIVLEGRDRIGGRLVTDRTWPGVALDLGASWIHGAKGNPVTELAKSLGLETRVTTWERVRIYEPGKGALSDDEALHAAKVLKKVLRAAEDDGPKASARLRELVDREADSLSLPEHDRLELAYEVTAEIEQDFACDASELAWAGLQEGKSDRGDDLCFPGGYDRILDGLTGGVDVRLGHVVSRIAHDDKGVRIETSHGTFSAARAIVTLPLGVLQAGKITFEPALEERKVRAVNAMAMGVLDKIYLSFPKSFWPDDIEIFGRLARGGDFIATVNMQFYSGKPVLMCFHAGSRALAIEAMTDREVVAAATRHLSEMFGSSTPDPDAAIVTRWARDPFALGSYSHLPPGATPADRVALAAPIAGRLFFAGEATESDYPATIRGAYASGRREAKRILAG